MSNKKHEWRQNYTRRNKPAFYLSRKIVKSYTVFLQSLTSKNRVWSDKLAQIHTEISSLQQLIRNGEDKNDAFKGQLRTNINVARKILTEIENTITTIDEITDLFLKYNVSYKRVGGNHSFSLKNILKDYASNFYCIFHLVAAFDAIVNSELPCDEKKNRLTSSVIHIHRVIDVYEDLKQHLTETDYSHFHVYCDLISYHYTERNDDEIEMLNTIFFKLKESSITTICLLECAVTFANLAITSDKHENDYVYIILGTVENFTQTIKEEPLSEEKAKRYAILAESLSNLSHKCAIYAKKYNDLLLKYLEDKVLRLSCLYKEGIYLQRAIGHMDAHLIINEFLQRSSQEDVLQTKSEWETRVTKISAELNKTCDTEERRSGQLAEELIKEENPSQLNGEKSKIVIKNMALHKKNKSQSKSPKPPGQNASQQTRKPKLMLDPPKINAVSSSELFLSNSNPLEIKRKKNTIKFSEILREEKKPKNNSNATTIKTSNKHSHNNSLEFFSDNSRQQRAATLIMSVPEKNTRTISYAKTEFDGRMYSDVVSGKTTQKLESKTTPRLTSIKPVNGYKMKHSQQTTLLLNKIEEKGYKGYVYGGRVRDVILDNQNADADDDIKTDCPINIIESILKENNIALNLLQSKHRKNLFRDYKKKVDITIYDNLDDANNQRQGLITINTLYSNAKGNIYDPLGIIADFKSPTIHLTEHALSILTKGPHNVFKLIYLANKTNKTNKTLDETTLTLIKKLAPRIKSGGFFLCNYHFKHCLMAKSTIQNISLLLEIVLNQSIARFM